MLFRLFSFSAFDNPKRFIVIKVAGICGTKKKRSAKAERYHYFQKLPGSYCLLQFLLVANRQLVTAFGTTAGQHLTTISRLHALTESMNGFAAAAMRLKCTFHCLISFFTLRNHPWRAGFVSVYLQVTTPVGFVKGRQR